MDAIDNISIGASLDEVPRELIVIMLSYLDSIDIKNFLRFYGRSFDYKELIYEELVKLRFPNDYLDVRTILRDCHFIWKDTYEDLLSDINNQFFPGKIHRFRKIHPLMYDVLVKYDKEFGCNKYILYCEQIEQFYLVFRSEHLDTELPTLPDGLMEKLLLHFSYFYNDII